MNNIRTLLLVMAYGLIHMGCAKMEVRKPLNTASGKPDQVTDVQVENHGGYALITYRLPINDDVKYVLAEYQVNNTTKRQAKASVGLNQIKVEGFNDKAAYQVALYAVNKGEIKSDPVLVEVNPDVPPFRNVYGSLKMDVGFGGVTVSFANPDSADVAIGVVTRDVNDQFYTANTLYTSSSEGTFATRGFEPEARLFGVYVRDKFNNYSDTIFGEFVPLLERQLDKSKFKEYVLPNDTEVAYGWVRSNLWDNNLNNGYHTPEPVASMPAYLTIDLGVTATLSRFKIWQRSGLYFQWGNPREWTMWGATDPNPNGSMDESWIYLMDCESVKPSGGASNTAEDNAYAAAGEEFEFPPGTPPVRYIRMELRRSWSDSPRFHFMELTFWGD